MRLRVSGEQTGNTYNLQAVMGATVSGAGIAHHELMNHFAEAICAMDTMRTSDVREALTQALGEAVMVDAAAVIAAFNAYPRMADATGIPLEDAKREATASLRAELGLDAFKAGSPIVVYIHGGAWTRSSKTHVSYPAEAFIGDRFRSTRSMIPPNVA